MEKRLLNEFEMLTQITRCLYCYFDNLRHRNEFNGPHQYTADLLCLKLAQHGVKCCHLHFAVINQHFKIKIIIKKHEKGKSLET